MTCENCNRSNAFKAYCFFSKRTLYFKEVNRCMFSPESFVLYAIEMQLQWKLKVYCGLKETTEFNGYWQVLQDPLKKALRYLNTESL